MHGLIYRLAVVSALYIAGLYVVSGTKSKLNVKRPLSGHETRAVLIHDTLMSFVVQYSGIHKERFCALQTLRYEKL